MKLHSPERKPQKPTILAKDLLERPPEEAVELFDFAGEFSRIESDLKDLLNITKEKGFHPMEDYWIALGQIQIFFPKFRDLRSELDFSRMIKVLVQESRQSTTGILHLFYLMQLFPKKRKELERDSKMDQVNMPTKNLRGELFFTNELLVLASAHPERQAEFHLRVVQEVQAVKDWMAESLKYKNQLRVVLELAANFLILCPEYKAELQAELKAESAYIKEYLQHGSATERFGVLCNLKVIFGTDNFVINGQGNLVRQPGTVKLKEARRLPVRDVT